MRKIRNIQISTPSMGDEEWLATKECFETGWLTTGKKVAAFEDKFAELHKVEHAIATTSCTTALHLILAALDIGPGDEVLVPAFTWVSTANVVLYVGATPIFVDVDPATNNINPKELKKKLTKRTKAVIVVHLFGLCAPIDEIKAELPLNVRIIEDAACATGATYKGRPAGSLGDAAAFSFHPRKSITTGEGGMVTTNDADLAKKMDVLRNHGASISEQQRHLGPKPYLLPEFNQLGFNYRMTDIQGAIGLVQLSKLQSFVAEREYWAKFYIDKLKDIEWLRMPVLPPSNSTHAWQAFVTFVDKNKAPAPRNDIMEYLKTHGVATRPGTHAVHKLGFYEKKFAFKAADYSGADECDKNTMALPLHNEMTLEDYEYVINTIKNFAK